MFRAKLMLLGVFAVAMSAMVSASASAAVQHWDVCEELTSSVSNGFTTLEKCVKSEGPTGGKWTKYKLPVGTVLKVDSKGTVTFIIKGTVIGLTIKIECTAEANNGTIENPTGGGAGKDTSTIKFSGCTVPEPTGQGCIVTEPIVAEATTELTEFSAKPADLFKPKNTNFTSITFTGCSSGELNKTYPISGTFTGIALNNTSEQEFTNESSNLTFGGEPFKLKGKSSLLMEGNKANILVLP